MVYIYKVYGICISSEFELPSAYRCEDGNAEITITQRDFSTEYQYATEIRETKQKMGIEIYTVTEMLDGKELVHIFDIGSFLIVSGFQIACMKCENCDLYQFEQWILNMCIPVAMIMQEKVVLHGSGLKYKNELLVISGVSGSGKSTLTDALLVQDDFSFVSDDSVALEVDDGQVYGKGAYPLRRLCSDAVTQAGYQPEELIFISDGNKEKYGIKMEKEFTPEAIPLKHLFIVNPTETEEVQIKEISGSEKLKELLDCLYKKDTYMKIGMTPKLMMMCMKMAENLKIYQINRPQGRMTVQQQKLLVKEVLEENRLS